MLRTKEKILDAILDNTLDLISFHDMEGRYEYLSTSVKDILGWDEKDLLGKSAYEFFHPDDAKRIEEESHNNVKAGKRNAVIDYRLRCKDGSYKWMQTLSHPILDDEGIPVKILAVTRDISKFKRLEEEYTLRQALSHETERLAKVGGWEVDLVNNQVWWSDVVKEIHEVEPDFIPSLEQGINFYAPEHRDIINKAVEEGIREGKGWDVELDIITAKGNRVSVRALGKVDFEDGKPIRLYGAFQDITERKKATAETELLKARLETATRAGGIGVWDWDIINDVLEWDDNTFKLYGVTREDFSAAYDAWENGLHPDDKANAVKEVEKALSGEKDFDTVFRVIHPSGDIRYIKGNADVIRDESGKPIRMVGVNYDVTERIERETELKLSEEKFRGSFENSAVGKGIVSLEGKMTQVNQAWCDMLGYTKDELTKLTFQEFTHPDDLKEDLEHVYALIEGKADSYQMEKRYFHKDGSIVWVILSVSIVRDLERHPLFFISEVQDITERKKVEYQQRDLVDKLTMHNNQLKEYNSIVSHNLRAPVSNLNALMNLLAVVEDNEKEFLTQQINSSIEKITETLDHLVEVVKIRDDKDIEFLENNLEDVYGKVRDQLLGKILESNVNITTDFKEVSNVSYPPLYLESIFLNMIDNAIKYRSENRPLKISINSKVNGKYNIINFADNGLGIDLSRHGDKMFKLHKTFHRRKDSKGFGLFMLKNQLEAMGGSISCESEVDKGTTFVVKILK